MSWAPGFLVARALLQHLRAPDRTRSWRHRPVARRHRVVPVEALQKGLLARRGRRTGQGDGQRRRARSMAERAIEGACRYRCPDARPGASSRHRTIQVIRRGRRSFAIIPRDGWPICFTSGRKRGSWCCRRRRVWSRAARPNSSKKRSKPASRQGVQRVLRRHARGARDRQRRRPRARSWPHIVRTAGAAVHVSSARTRRSAKSCACRCSSRSSPSTTRSRVARATPFPWLGIAHGVVGRR